MRYYAGQRFTGTVGGTVHMFSTVERFAGGPVEVEADTGARFPTSALSAMLDRLVVAPVHTCMTGQAATVPAFVLAERCSACQGAGTADAPAAWVEAVYGPVAS